MQVIPSIDVENGRSRLVFWPGAGRGEGTPTDRPERIARHFVERGAPLVHVVDLDGARAGQPVNTAAIEAIARAVATPLQVAGGIDGPEQIELAFAAGATRVVMPLAAVAEEPERLAASLRVAGEWLAVGLDARPDRLREYPWRASAPPRLEELVERLAEAGVARVVLAHADPSAAGELLSRLRGLGLTILVAGGIGDVEAVTSLRAAGVDGLILGEALLSGRLDFEAAKAAAA